MFSFFALPVSLAILLSVGGCSKDDSYEEPSREQRFIALYESVNGLEQLTTFTRSARELHLVLRDIESFQADYPDDLGVNFADLCVRTSTAAGRYYEQISPESYSKMCVLRDSLDIRDADYLLYDMDQILNLRQYLSADEVQVWEDRVLEYALVAPQYCGAFNTQSITSRVWNSHAPRQEISERIYQIALMQHAFCVKDGCLPEAGHEFLAMVSPVTFHCSTPDATVAYAYYWGARAGHENSEIGAEVSTIISQCHMTGYYVPIK